MTDGGCDCNRTLKGIVTIYSWVSIQRSKYCDFSASRRDTRAKFRRLISAEKTVVVRKAEAQAPLTEAAAQAAASQLSSQIQHPTEDQVQNQVQTQMKPEVTAWKRGLPLQIGSAPAIEDLGREMQGGDEHIGGLPIATPETTAEDPTAETGTLEQPETHVASRWFALQAIVARAGEAAEARDNVPKVERLVPAVAVFSMAGGVGKTSLVATLGRVLASHGEQVLLAETSSFGILPLFFGSRDFKPGVVKPDVVRTFEPPAGSTDAPVQAVALNVEQFLQKDARGLLREVLLRNARSSKRILIDIPTASRTMMQHLLPLATVVLVPLLPDMNSVMSLVVVESVFASKEDSAEHAIHPTYLLNQFDPSLRLHVDVRAILQQQLGSRLLPFVVRSSAAVSEAMAEGMTVLDYAPNSSTVEDYLHLANWLGSVSPVVASGFSGVRWRERGSTALEGKLSPIGMNVPNPV